MESPFPLQETSLRLPSGRTVTVFNVVLFRQLDGVGYVAVFYYSSVPATDGVARRDEASEVAAMYGPLADSQGFGRISARLCSTREAIELREAPELIISFHRGIDGSWIHDAANG